jgi:hypothetical protein
MRFAAIILILILSVTTAIASDMPAVDRTIQGLVELLNDTHSGEFKAARKIHYLKEEVERVLVFFTLEGFCGGNNYTHYLAVLEPDCGGDGDTMEYPREMSKRSEVTPVKKYRLVGYVSVGGKGWRSVNFSTFEMNANVITLHTLEYGANDPMSNPTKPGRAAYKIESRRIVELLLDQSFEKTSVGKPPSVPQLER